MQLQPSGGCSCCGGFRLQWDRCCGHAVDYRGEEQPAHGLPPRPRCTAGCGLWAVPTLLSASMRALTQRLPARPPPPCLPPQRRVLRWVGQLASEQSVLQALEEAGAVPYVVGQLRRQGDPELQVGRADTGGWIAGSTAC